MPVYSCSITVSVGGVTSWTSFDVDAGTVEDAATAAVAGLVSPEDEAAGVERMSIDLRRRD